jgi:hypothetical protein
LNLFLRFCFSCSSSISRNLSSCSFNKDSCSAVISSCSFIISSIDDDTLPNNSSAAVKSPAKSSAKSKSILGNSGKSTVSGPNPKSSISSAFSSNGSSGSGKFTISGSPE